MLANVNCPLESAVMVSPVSINFAIAPVMGKLLTPSNTRPFNVRVVGACKPVVV